MSEFWATFKVDKHGTKRWYHSGKLHRDGGPAVLNPDGSCTWYRYGKIHRDDGPAVYGDGYRIWYQNGEYHRDGGPAFECDGGWSSWYQYGKLHRLDGPATKAPSWYFEGYRVTQEQLERIAARIRHRKNKIKAFILDRLLPQIYDPCRKSGYRRMLESYLDLNLT